MNGSIKMAIKREIKVTWHRCAQRSFNRIDQVAPMCTSCNTWFLGSGERTGYFQKHSLGGCAIEGATLSGRNRRDISFRRVLGETVCFDGAHHQHFEQSSSPAGGMTGTCTERKPRPDRTLIGTHNQASRHLIINCRCIAGWMSLLQLEQIAATRPDRMARPQSALIATVTSSQRCICS